MHFVARGVAFEFLHPPGATMRWRRAVPASAMSMPETPVNEDGDFVFRKNNIGSYKPTPDPSVEGNFWARAIRHLCPSVFICGFILSFSDSDFDIQPKAITEAPEQ